MSVSNLVSLQDKVILHCLGQQTYLLPSKVRAEATKAWDEHLSDLLANLG